MRATLFPAIGTAIVATLYWYVVASMLGVAEPWDADAYLPVAYPIALLLSALLARTYRAHGWLAGVIVVFAQLPVMLTLSQAGPLLTVGFLFLGLLSLPAMLTAWLSARIGRRRGTR